MKKSIKGLFFCIGIICLCQSAQAFYYWSNSSGSTAYFDWSNGGSENGIYGDPIIITENTFVFFPANFRAESSGDFDSIYDRMEFDLNFHLGFCLSGIKVIEYGDYGILGEGSVQATGSLTMTKLTTGQVLSETIIMNPTFPVTSGAGTWKGTAELENLFCTLVKVSIENELVAISSETSTSYIQKKGAASAIAITIIPEPTGMILLALGGLFLRKR